MTHRSRRSAVVGIALAALQLAACGTANPGAWTAHSAGSRATVDHRAWQLFLDRHSFAGADGVTRVAYAEVPGTDRELLDQYVAGLERVPVGRLDRAEQLAFWLNLHNALAVRVVLGHLIARSPDDIDLGGPLAPAGPWTATLARVDGIPVSLRAIRDAALQPVFRDPRWQYGLCDTTLGGPSLPRTAFAGATVDRALEDAAIAYVNHPRALRIESDALVVNGFWRRNRDSFGGSDAAVLDHIAVYADRELRAELHPDRPIRWSDDRRLNEWPGP